MVRPFYCFSAGLPAVAAFVATFMSAAVAVLLCGLRVWTRCGRACVLRICCGCALWFCCRLRTICCEVALRDEYVVALELV